MIILFVITPPDVALYLLSTLSSVFQYNLSEHRWEALVLKAETGQKIMQDAPLMYRSIYHV
jgi:hypothetical protein